MINFIVCDDEARITDLIKNIITKSIFKTSIDYKIHIFNEYNKEFIKLINSNLQNKIYILDIDVKGKSGIEISKQIREKDWDSVLLIVTSHYELETLAFKSKILLFDFISKFDLFDKKINESILECINKVLSEERLVVKINRQINRIEYKNILYIMYDSYKRKTIIQTINEKYETNESLISIYKRIKGNFLYSHKACIVNMNNVLQIDSKNKVITFKNKYETDLLSRKYIKEVKEHANN